MSSGTVATLFLALVATWSTASAQLERVPQQRVHIHTLVGHKNDVSSLAATPDGESFLSASQGQVFVWRVRDGARTLSLVHPDWAMALAVTPDGETIVTGGSDNGIRLWRMDNAGLVRTIFRHTDWVVALDVTPAGDQIVSGSYDGTVRLWSVDSGRQLLDLDAHAGGVHDVEIGADGERLVTCGVDSMIRVWHLPDGQLVRTLRGHLGQVSSVSISPTGAFIASAGTDSTVRVWSADDGELLHTLRGHEGAVSAVAITTGLLMKLNRDELQGVMAHEMSHVRNRDILFMTMAGIPVELKSLGMQWADIASGEDLNG